MTSLKSLSTLKPALWRQWLAFGLVLGAIVLAVCFERYHSRRAILAQEFARIQTLARLSETSLVDQILAINRLTVEIRDQEMPKQVNDPQSGGISKSLFRLSQLVPGVHTLSLANANGALVASSRAEVVGRNVSNNSYFQKAQQTLDRNLLLISEPELAAPNVYTVQFVRPIFNKAGNFEGVVIATLDPDFFARMLSTAFYADDLRCVLLHEDGAVFQSVGDFHPKPGFNMDKPGSLFRKHKESGAAETLIHGVGANPSESRIGVLRNLSAQMLHSDKHLLIAFTRSEEKVLAIWTHDTQQLTILLGILTVCVAAALLFYQRRQMVSWHLAQQQSNLKVTSDRENLKLLALVNESPDFIATFDMQGVALHINPAGLKLLGIPESSPISSIQLREVCSARASEQLDGEVFPALISQGAWQGELSFVDRKGHEIALTQSVFIHKDAFGSPLYFSTIAHDISQIKETEKALVVAKQLAQEASQAKSRFLATMSHEIRTPLNAIIGMSYLLGDTKLDHDQKDEVRAISTSSNNLLALINDILDLSKIEAGEMQLEAYSFSLPEMCRELRHMYSVLIAEKGLKFELTLDERIPAFIHGDGNRLRQMVNNYMSNAMKFTKHGAIVFAVQELRRDIAADVVWLRLSVSDTGIGISESVQKTLFEPFKQADTSTSRQFGGTGLGLSIVKQLAEMMGGHVGLDSELGKGSTFWLELPFGISEHEGQSEERNLFGDGPLDRAIEQVAIFDALKGARVLIVDDSYTNLDVCYRILTMKGVKVTLCESGAEALTTLKSSPYGFDVILMDVQMPGLSGIETTKAIRSDLNFNDIPVLALSAGATKEEKQEALDSGMNDFLSKPIQPANLFKILSTYVQLTISRRNQQGSCAIEQVWPILAGIDAKLSERLFGGDVDQFKRCLTIFIEEHAQSVERIKVWMDGGEFVLATQLLDKLGEQASGIGATRLQEASKSLAGALKVNALNDVSMKFDDFVDAAGDFF